MRRPGLRLGALVGLLLTAALTAVLFLAQRLVGAPFLPFDLFDWLARVLPGGVVTFGIDAMVDTILLLNLGAVSDVAKTAEQALAVAMFVLGGAVVGAVFYAATRGRDDDGTAAPATLLGLLLGLGAFLVSLRISSVTAAWPLRSALWILASYGAWGALLGWSRDRLASAGATDATPPAARATDALKPASPDAHAERLDRRRFLIQLGGATAFITVAGAGLGVYLRDEVTTAGTAGSDDGAQAVAAWSDANPLPNADADVAPAPGTRPEFTPLDEHYRIDINTVPPSVDGDTWTLDVRGLVEEPLQLTMEELQAYPATHQFVTLACISNRLGGDLISTTRWTGVPLQRLLPDLGLRDEATHLVISSVDGFYEVVPIETALVDERVMLCYAWDGLPLPQRNGYPLRVYVPDVYGMKQPKWIDAIEVTDAWEPGYWVERGWDEQARMRATTVIDTVATNMMITDVDDGPLIPIGGIAHAGARGISRVEVRVDDGEWQEASLRRPLSGLTWAVWRFDWPFEEGQHTFTVRCVDGNGEPQIEERNPVRPAGATGLLSEDVML